MNKLETSYLGGHPLTLEDLEFFQNGLMEAFNGLASVWQYGSSDSIILSGLQGTISGPNVTYTSGFVVVNSEVYYVPSATIPTAGGFVIDIGQTIDTAGDIQYEDLTTHSTYLVRRGILKNPVGSPTEIDIADFITLKDRLLSITGALTSLETAWAGVTFNGSWANTTYSVYYPSNAVRYRKNKIATIELEGSATCPSGSISALMFTLPTGFRPSKLKVYPAVVIDLVLGTLIGRVLVKANGEVSFETNTPTSGDVTVSLDGINITI